MKTSAAQTTKSGGEGGSVLTAAAIAQLVGGKVMGDAAATVTSVASLDRAASGQLSFCASAKYAPLLADTRASVVLLAPECAAAETPAPARIVVERPHESILSVLPRLYRIGEREPGIHPTAVIGRGATFGKDVAVGPYAVIGDGAQLGDRVTVDAHCSVGAGVRLGNDAHLFPNVVIYGGTTIGDRVAIHGGAVIGSDGFGYVSKRDRHEKIPHVGRCIIEDDVEIGAGTTIDRGSIDDTVIGAGTKIDNLVMIAHNVRIGRLCLIAAQAGISGSVRIEDGCIIGGQSGFQGHHTVGKGARIGAQSGVLGDVPPGETWSGYPARPHRESMRAYAALFKLSSMMKHIERITGAGKSSDRGDSD